MTDKIDPGNTPQPDLDFGDGSEPPGYRDDCLAYPHSELAGSAFVGSYTSGGLVVFDQAVRCECCGATVPASDAVAQYNEWPDSMEWWACRACVGNAPTLRTGQAVSK